jgi:hypothetical protein
MTLFGAAKSGMPHDPREKIRARELMGRGDTAK